MNRVLTLGAVIRVPEPFASRARQVRDVAGDPLARVVPPHITLLPPTRIDVGRLSVIHAHVARVGRRTPPFDVVLAGTASFRPVTPVVFMRVATGHEECARLAADVCSGPLEQPPEYPYHPHVTLAHNVPQARLDAVEQRMNQARFDFRVTEFGLFQREEGESWAIVDVVRLLADQARPDRSARAGGLDTA